MEDLYNILRTLNFSDEEINNLILTVDKDKSKIQRLYYFVKQENNRDMIYRYAMKLGGLGNSEIIIED